METKLIWDEDKRIKNLAKHHLDFADAINVLESHYRLDVTVMRGGETRMQSFAYVMNCLHVLTAKAQRGLSAIAQQARKKR